MPRREVNMNPTKEAGGGRTGEGDPEVSLREVTKETLRSVLLLKVSPAQEKFVASNAVSIAQAHFEEKAWFRAIYAGETPVGFLMLRDDPEAREYILWRLMIDARYQGKGYGRAAIELLKEHVRTRPGAEVLYTGHEPGEGSPAGFYQRLGFVYTGELEEDELIMKIAL
jgi:diamine N-acetyltransferase